MHICVHGLFKERDESRDPVSCFLGAISMRKCTLKKDLFIPLGPKGTVKAKTFAAAEVKKKDWCVRVAIIRISLSSPRQVGERNFSNGKVIHLWASLNATLLW